MRAQADELARRLIQSVFLEMFGDPVKNPKGWKTEKLKAIPERFSAGPFGSNLKTEHYTDEGIRVIRLQNIGVSKFVDDDRAYISQEHFSILQKHACTSGDVLIGTMGDPNLRACILPDSVALAINKADCVQCRPNQNKVLPEYVCHLLNLPSLLKAASNLVHGETRGRISSGQLANLSIPIPPLSFQERFSRIVEAAEQMISSQNQSQNEIIKNLDSILQKAFTGELVA
jgi:type I restriction enzyme, S subunit